MKITRAVVPSLFTVLNMFSGFMSIIDSARGEFIPASWMIVLAAGFDAMDGIMARITRSSSQFGVEIDSLSDVISFGAAPAFLVYRMSLSQLDALGILISSLLMVFAGLRLARFNVQLVGFDKNYFTGLPTPPSAIAVASLTLISWDPVTGLNPIAETCLPWLVVALSLLMVSKVKYDLVPRLSRRAFRKQPWKFIIVGVALIVVLVNGGKAIFPVLLLYILFGVLRYAVVTVKRLLQSGSKFEDDEAVEPSHIDT